jgi:uncharacterized protein YjaZ
MSPKPFATADFSVSAEVSSATRRAGVDIDAIVGATVDHVDDALPGTLGAVYIDVEADEAIPRFGMGGYTSTSGSTVFIHLDPNRRDFGSEIEARLPALLAHELDHSVRFSEGPGPSDDLLEAMISEGIADAFAGQAYPEAEPFPWDDALTPAQERRQWRAVQPVLHAGLSERLHQRWIIAGGAVPHWTGYTIGYHIVRAYLAAHTDSSAAELTLVDAGEIFKGSNYSP